MKTSPIRGLHIGAGQFSLVQLSAWKEIPGVEIVGICNRTESKASQLAEAFKIPHVGSHPETMLDKLKPDFVDICNAVQGHKVMVEASADRGIPILCQKPICPTREESEALVGYVEDRETPLMINDNWRWQPWYREIHKLINEEKILGDLFNAYISMRTGDGWGEYPYEQQPYFREMEQFLILETGIHYLDTFRYLFGEVESLYCSVRKRNPVIRGEDQASMILNFENSMVVTWDANRAAYSPRFKPPFNGTMKIDGSNGYLEIDENGRIKISLRSGRTLEPRYDIPEGYRGGSATRAQAHFISGLRNGGKFETSGADYLKTTHLVAAAYESAQTRNPVTLSL